MEFWLEGSAGAWKEECGILLRDRGHSLSPEGYRIHSSEGEAGILTVRIREREAFITFEKRVHFFRGLMHVLNHLERKGQEAQLCIKEQVSFSTVGAMLDCSRNGVLKPEAVKEYIHRLAFSGMDTLMLYTEDTYEIGGYPYFGAFRGRYTNEELKELDRYASGFGIEMIPCIQTLAHLHTALRWREHAALRDTEDIILTDEEEVYRLLGAMIKTMSEAFSTRRIYIGMDEAHSLGLGEALRRYGFRNRFSIMNNHLLQVKALCEAYGFEPMMWSDMYFRLHSETGGYYDLPADTDLSGTDKPPEGVGLVYWDYYNTDAEHYRSYFKLHRQLSPLVAFAGGAWTFNGMAPNYAMMEANARAALPVCIEEGIPEVICTFWQDNGAETPLETGIPALALYSAYGFIPEEQEQGADDPIRRADVLTRFLTGTDYSTFRLLDEFDNVPGALPDNRAADNPSKYLFYQDVLTGLFDGQIRGLMLAEHYRQLSCRLRAFLGSNPGAPELFRYYSLLAGVLEIKAELGNRIYDAYQSGNREELLQIEKAVLPHCAEMVRQASEQRRALWFKECKPFGYEVLDIRFAGVERRLLSASQRLEEYLTGKEKGLPELMEERLVYEKDEERPEHRLCQCNFWEFIVSAGNMAGI